MFPLSWKPLAYAAVRTALALAFLAAGVVKIQNPMTFAVTVDAFGILPGHADFLTALSISVVTWRDQAGAEHHLAVRGGMLEVRGGERVETESGPWRDLDATRAQQQTGVVALVIDEDVVAAVAGKQQLAGVGVEVQFHAQTLADLARP